MARSILTISIGSSGRPRQANYLSATLTGSAVALTPRPSWQNPSLSMKMSALFIWLRYLWIFTRAASASISIEGKVISEEPGALVWTTNPYEKLQPAALRTFICKLFSSRLSASSNTGSSQAHAIVVICIRALQGPHLLPGEHTPKTSSVMLDSLMPLDWRQCSGCVSKLK